MNEYDVVVIGGGAAGLSGALALARSRRSVLVVDEGTPRNAPAEHVHNFLTRDGVPPAELYALGRAEVIRYGAEVRSGTVTAVASRAGGFEVETAAGTAVRAKRLLVTTGLVDELPDVPGLAERFGKDVLHCPYCHGWEVRDQAIGVLATTDKAIHQTMLFRQLSDDVTLYLNDGPEPSEQEWEELAARGISVVLGKVAAVEVTGDKLTGVQLDGGKVVPCDALVVQAPGRARAGFLASLGLEAVDGPMGTAIPSELGGRTTVPGVFVAGNVADPGAQVISAAAAGLMAGAMINSDLIQEETRLAVAARSS
jgi:thioredoxin reductase (NADPH)